MSDLAPYITAWSDEEDSPCTVVERKGWGIAYADETLTDRDDGGVLWFRKPSRPRQGRPRFDQVHPLRQRRAMRRLLCQVCGGPADVTDDGVLWLLKDHRTDWPRWPENMAVTEPPICVPCVRVASRACPALRRGAAVIRVGSSPIVGVQGLLYRSGHAGPIPVGETIIAYDDPGIRWARAITLVRELRWCTILDAD
ncbi:hypothetical protein [Actinophytocola xanthii]|uniref:Uncharacterized protein n=1 Tax=Actinophytocola xanthii TaxID=1912961 RepID=A0A1Q8CYG1_9PSEU|nr:hypothetical protein [Actinophytocola xanthii]OLF19394.1 hypothetical protein BU204_00235 [Actinophytocola xanthii]